MIINTALLYVTSKFVSTIDRLFGALRRTLCWLWIPTWLNWILLETWAWKSHELSLYYMLIILADILLTFTDIFLIKIISWKMTYMWPVLAKRETHRMRHLTDYQSLVQINSARYLWSVITTLINTLYLPRGRVVLRCNNWTSIKTCLPFEQIRVVGYYWF